MDRKLDHWSISSSDRSIIINPTGSGIASHGYLSTRPGSDTCRFQHDLPTMSLSILIVVGMLISYIPQHYRIIKSKSSQGINFWFLLLGSTSSTSSLVNVVTLQWGVMRCCQYLKLGECAESLLGIVQIFLQWACFNLILILSLVYFPPDEKYVRVVPVGSRDRESSPFDRVTNYSSRFLSRFFLKKKTRSTSSHNNQQGSSKLTSGNPSRPVFYRSDSNISSSNSSVSSSDSSSFNPSDVLPPSATRFTPLTLSKEYTISVVLSIVMLLHFLLSLLVTVCLLLLLPKATVGEPSGHPPSHSAEHPTVRLLRIWATCAGLLSAVLAGFQYLPQIFSTWKLKLVGSLSIPMMVIQTPGSFVFVYSLAVRPGVNWTTWIVYFVSGIFQACLLAICITWKVRQKSLGIDDWGRPLVSSHHSEEPALGSDDNSGLSRSNIHSERTPLLVPSTRSDVLRRAVSGTNQNRSKQQRERHSP
ncbi:hypothetical protein PPACK8108_LOCUS405 [Phakopsora pachyrhizi]|uniref:Uncharacterized protein n=1 Tax=Phakopsora pachyrhizi TaxID=170000 RepID=A0AAV0AFB3_PHAPC|nr:hypothetical protein PPACK8108_LOCUS405 [Phakopsora pachyrhizi]